jgi:hypothetical protein
MTEIILTFPVRRTAPLSCIWIRTGNPAQPLICRWTSGSRSSAGLPTDEANESGAVGFARDSIQTAGADVSQINSEVAALDQKKKAGICVGNAL